MNATQVDEDLQSENLRYAVENATLKAELAGRLQPANAEHARNAEPEPEQGNVALSAPAAAPAIPAVQANPPIPPA